MALRAILLLLALLALPGAEAASTTVRALGGFFDPAELDVRVGDEIVFVNEDTMAHTVTSTWDDGETFDVILRGGESYAHRFGSEGAWPIHCRPHAGMEMSVQATKIETGAQIAAPVPAPAVAFVIVAIAIAMLSMRRRG